MKCTMTIIDQKLSSPVTCTYSFKIIQHNQNNAWDNIAHCLTGNSVFR